jgi:hypothetical protein
MQDNKPKRQEPVLVSSGRAAPSVTPESPAQDVVNAVYKKGFGPANDRGIAIARGILRTSQHAEAAKRRRVA